MYTNKEDWKTRILRTGLHVALGILVGSAAVSLTPVGAQVSEGLARVFIANDVKDPIPVFSTDTMRVQGDVKIDGKPEVRLDGDTKIKIESIDRPVTVEFEKNDGTWIFKDGKSYAISFTGAKQKSCRVDKIEGSWIYCERKGREGEIVGWVNSSQLALVSEL